METNEFKEILKKHKMWLKGEEGGKRADLRGADLSYSSFPLSCKGLHIHLDDRIGIQLLYHAIANILFSKNTSDELKEQVSVLVDVANKFHRVEECGELKPFVKEDINNE